MSSMKQRSDVDVYVDGEPPPPKVFQAIDDHMMMRRVVFEQEGGIRPESDERPPLEWGVDLLYAGLALLAVVIVLAIGDMLLLELAMKPGWWPLAVAGFLVMNYVGYLTAGLASSIATRRRENHDHDYR